MADMGAALFAHEARIEDGVRAINSGHLLKAKTILHEISDSRAASALERAVACKHLGTVLFRLGEEYRSAFASSRRLFEAELQRNYSVPAGLRTVEEKVCTQFGTCANHSRVAQ